MCGIVGGIYKNSMPNEARLQLAVKALHHRGPDESGIHCVDNVALGHARLSIIDLEGGKQPLTSSNGQLHLVCNGEVYNYVEVAEKYSEIAATSRTKSDSEAILQVYEACGIEGIQLLNGMFAFVLYDQQRKQTILARDRLGIKPLYYCETSEGYFFASEIKALLPMLDSSPTIAPESLYQFLQYQFVVGRDTIFNEIKRVLPGEIVTIKGGKASFDRFWEPERVTQIPRSVPGSLEEFQGLFDQVMAEHMRADVPFGLFLSGGIDSSVLLAELAKLHQQPLRTYSIGYQGVKMEDELDAAEALAQKFGAQHTSIRVSRDQLFERIVYSIWAADDLMRDYATLPTLALAERAAQDLKIVFSGEGGDEAFAGYKRYAPKASRWVLHSLLRQDFKPNRQWSSTASKAIFSEKMQPSKAYREYSNLWRSAPAHWSTMNKRQFTDIRASLADNLFVKTDRMLMAHGLEGRVPFSDHRIIEFGLSLQDNLKYRDNRGKWLIRQWAEQALPAEHLRKPKRGFYVPVNEWLQGDFLDKLSQKLSTNKAIGEWFNRDGVNTILRAAKSGKNYSREIWGLMQFAIWHRLFVEGGHRTPTIKENPLDWL